MSSFLNSILSSIGGNEPPKDSATTAKTVTTVAKKTEVTVKNMNATGASSLAPLKRKPDPLPNPPPAKTARTEAPISRPSIGNIASHPKPGPGNAVITPSTGPLRIEATKQLFSANAKPSASLPKTTITQAPSVPQLKVTSTQVSSNTPSAKSPAKNSYREILQRAEATKAAQADFGKIKHKPVPNHPKLSRKERLAQDAEAAQKAKQEARSSKVGTRNGRVQPSNRPVSKGLEQVKEKKKPVDLGYKGTMRQAPTAPTYKGTMKTQAPISARSARPTERVLPKSMSKHPPDSASTSQRYKYATYSDEEDEEEEEEDYDDESDDMEAAGFDDLEEEEQQSLRAAKKEDEEALKEENEHKRLKAEKRRKLEELAARKRK